MPIISRRPCFFRVAWGTSSHLLFLWFSDGTRYVFSTWSYGDFTALRDALKHGIYYNASLRGLRDLGTKINYWPTTLIEEFRGTD